VKGRRGKMISHFQIMKIIFPYSRKPLFRVPNTKKSKKKYLLGSCFSRNEWNLNTKIFFLLSIKKKLQNASYWPSIDSSLLKIATITREAIFLIKKDHPLFEFAYKIPYGVCDLAKQIKRRLWCQLE